MRVEKIRPIHSPFAPVRSKMIRNDFCMTCMPKNNLISYQMSLVGFTGQTHYLYIHRGEMGASACMTHNRFVYSITVGRHILNARICHDRGVHGEPLCTQKQLIEAGYTYKGTG